MFLQYEAICELIAGIAIVPLIAVQIHRLLATCLAHILRVATVSLG